MFAGMWDISDIANDYKSIFTIDENGVSSPIARTIAMGRGGTLPVSAVIAAKAFENDPKFSPDGTRIAFMRKINTTNSTYDHGFHIFITSASGVPGSEVDISDATIGHDPFFNDAVPEWVDNNNLVFFTLNVVNGTLVQKLYSMKVDGSLRTEIPLPKGYYYSDPIPYIDAAGKTRILFAANKSNASCSR